MHSTKFNPRDMTLPNKGTISMNKMAVRDIDWISKGMQLHSGRFAVNLDKITRVSSKVKKGELLDAKGSTDACSDLDMKHFRSRNEDLFGNKSLSQTNLDYDVNWESVQTNTHKEYKSNFLRIVNKEKLQDKKLFNRFSDNCSYKTVGTYGVNNLGNAVVTFARPGQYNM